jgi:hypothetical protein
MQSSREIANSLKSEDFTNHDEFLHTKYILEALAESEEATTKPNAKWYTHEEVFENARKKLRCID